MKKTIIIIIVILILAGGGYYLFTHNQAKAPADDQSQQNQTAADNSSLSGQNPASVPTAPAATKPNPGAPVYAPPASAGEPPAPNIQVAEVDFNGSAFSPSPVNIKINDWVFFKNKSQTDMWVASNPHPTHTDYPGFDSKQAIAPGGEYKFQFTKAGSWGYHDHLDPTIGGVVQVNQ